jgi:hypothetical protein
MPKIEATPYMLTCLKRAIRATEQAWDAERDLELECGKDYDGLSEFVNDLAVCGPDGVTLEDLQNFLDSDDHYADGEEGAA